MGQWFPILCGVRQGGVLSPYLYAIYVDDLIKELRCSGYGVHIGSVFVGSLFYARPIIVRYLQYSVTNIIGSIILPTSCAGGPTICPAPCKLTFDLLTLKIVSESRVTWATCMVSGVRTKCHWTKWHRTKCPGRNATGQNATGHNATGQNATNSGNCFFLLLMLFQFVCCMHLRPYKNCDS